MSRGKSFRPSSIDSRIDTESKEFSYAFYFLVADVICSDIQESNSCQMDIWSIFYLRCLETILLSPKVRKCLEVTIEALGTCHYSIKALKKNNKQKS